VHQFSSDNLLWQEAIALFLRTKLQVSGFHRNQDPAFSAAS